MSVDASAPGKVILAGEHAVVYGAPAIAIALSTLRARATGISTDKPLTIIAEDLMNTAIRIAAEESEPADPLAYMAFLTMRYLGLAGIQGEIRITSDIPIASGLGSGAAVSAALGRAIAQLHGAVMPDEDLNRLVFEVEKLHHGTPSGIDNTVVVFEQPLYYVKDAAIDFIDIAEPLVIALADSGIASLTRDAVADVRSLATDAPAPTARIFQAIGAIVKEARACIEGGDMKRLGELMTANHRLLQDLTVSSPELDKLVDAALKAGALGAKLSGGGRGGNIIALADADSVHELQLKLAEAGAKQVMATVTGSGPLNDHSD